MHCLSFPLIIKKLRLSEILGTPYAISNSECEKSKMKVIT